MRKTTFILVCALMAGCSGSVKRTAGDLLKTEPYEFLAERLFAAAVTVPPDWENLQSVQEPVPAQGAAQAEAASAPPSTPENFPKDWRYRDNFRVAEKSGAPLTDYQVSLVFDSSLPIKLGRMKPDCSDLRFANPNGTSELSYWLEDGCGTGRTRVWLRLPFLARNSVKNIYMYYGDPAARAASDGKSVFMLFDDFNGGVLDTSLWTVVPGDCRVEESGGRLQFTGCGSGSATSAPWVRSKAAFTPPYILDFDGFSENGGDNGQVHRVALRLDGQACDAYNRSTNAILLAFYDGHMPPVYGSFAQKIEACGAGDAVHGTRLLSPGVTYSFGITDTGGAVSASADGKPLFDAQNGFSGGVTLA